MNYSYYEVRLGCVRENFKMVVTGFRGVHHVRSRLGDRAGVLIEIKRLGGGLINGHAHLCRMGMVITANTKDSVHRKSSFAILNGHRNRRLCCKTQSLRHRLIPLEPALSTRCLIPTNRLNLPYRLGLLVTARLNPRRQA